MHTAPERLRRLALPAALTLLGVYALLTIPACNIVAPIAYAVQGPGDVDREYELDPTLATVIFVDDPSNKIATRRIRLAIGERAQDTLLRRKLIDNGKLIDTRSALLATSRDRDDRPLSIAEIGRSVSADVVIYAVITDFQTDAIGEATAPYAGMRVKLVDTTTAKRLWPEDEAGFPLRVSLPATGRINPSSRTEALQIQREVADRAGLALAQLFYTVELPQSVRR